MTETTQLQDAESFLAKLRQGTKQVYEIRARGLVIPVRMLSIDETLDIRNRCTAENSRKGGDQANLATLIQKETVRAASCLASGQSSVPLRFFDLITLDELIFIYGEWLRICESFNPSLEEVSPEQFNALIEVLKKKGTAATVNDCSLPQLKALAFNFIQLIQEQDSQA